jgi:hypothetical protein
MRKLDWFELLQIKFWGTVLHCLSILVVRASGIEPSQKQFDSTQTRIENFLDELIKTEKAYIQEMENENRQSANR